MNDIIVSETNDLTIFAGDFAIGDSTSQEVEAILMSFQGWWKQFPLIGCGAPSYIASPGECESLRRQAQIQLQSDGKQVSSFTYSFNTNGVLVININGITINVNG